MNEHERETAFLRQCILYGESTEYQELEEGMNQIQRDERCLRRAAWLMTVMAMLTAVGLGYTLVLGGNPLGDLSSELVVNIICALGMTSLISLLYFVNLGMVHRKKLNQRREECRQLIMKLLKSSLGKPATTPWQNRRDHRVSERVGNTVHVANEVNGSQAEIASAVRG